MGIWNAIKILAKDGQMDAVFSVLDKAVNDGGPGSGNFGHKGRPGKKGGSGKGGGKHYRSVQAEGLGGESKTTGGKTGFGGSRRDWVNGLSGHAANRADKLVTKFAPATTPKGMTITESADEHVMKNGSAAERCEWLELKSKARLFDTNMSRYLDTLDDGDRKAYDHILQKYGMDDGTGALEQSLIMGTMYEGEYIPGTAPDDVRDYFMGLKSKALEGSDGGAAMPDEVAYDLGLKERPVEHKMPDWASSLSTGNADAVKQLDESYGAEAQKQGKSLEQYVMESGSETHRDALLKAYQQSAGWSSFFKRAQARKKNTDDYDRAVFDLFHKKDIMKLSDGFTQEDRKLAWQSMHAHEMGLPVVPQIQDKLWSEVAKHGNYDLAMKGAIKFGDEKHFADVFESLKDREYVQIDLGGSLSVNSMKITRKGDQFELAMRFTGSPDYSTGTPVDAAKLSQALKRSFVDQSWPIDSVSQHDAPVIRTGTVGKAKIADSYKDVGSLKNFEATAAALKKSLYSGVTDAQIERASQTMTELIKSDKIAFTMRIPADVLESILDTHFMGQVELQDRGMKVDSGGTLDPALRARASKNMFGTVHRNKNGDQFEKYGYISTSDFTKDDEAGDASQYGNIIVHFKKDRMFGRSTYTMGDSLGHARSSDVLPGMIGTDGTASGMGTQHYDKQRGTQAMGSDAAYAAAVKGDIGKVRDVAGVGRYVEAQYHGELTMQQDVAEICFEYKSQMSALTPKVKKALKDAGIKVFYLEKGKTVEQSLD